VVAIDHRALGALAALSDLDIAVPDGISVIGLNGLGENSVFYQLPFSTTYQDSRLREKSASGTC